MEGGGRWDGGREEERVEGGVRGEEKVDEDYYGEEEEG